MHFTQTLLSIQFNSFSSVLLAGGILALLISVSFSQIKGDAVKWFSYTTVLIAVWAIGYSIELSCSSLNEMLFCSKVEYVGVALLPATWIVFVVKFIGKDEWLTSRKYLVVFAIPILTLLCNWTNGFHHLLYESTAVDNSSPFPLLAFKTGVWYKIHTAFFYFMVGAGIFFLINRIRTGSRIYKIQTKLILIGAVFPWLINIIYLCGVRPYGHLDLTPFGFILSSFCFGLGLVKFRLFDIVPIAHETIIEKMQEGVMILDGGARVEDINLAMEKIIEDYINKSRQKLNGSSLSEIFSNKKLLKAVYEKKNNKLELSLRGANASQHFAVTVTPLFKDTSEFKGTMLLFRDVTERKKTEEKLRRQAEESKNLSELKDKLFSIIAHDLRGPLSNLVSYFNLVEEGIISENELMANIPDLNQNINKVALLTDNLLLWSRSQLNGEVIKVEECDFGFSVDAIVHLYHAVLHKKNITLKKSIPSDIGVRADKDMLHVILRNLLSNAVKFTMVGGHITISAKKDGEYIIISIKDDGIGIRKKIADNLFSESITTLGTMNEKGTGLGLKLTKEFVEKNKGSIWVESKENEGTTFYFTLPAFHKRKPQKNLLDTVTDNV